MVALILIICLLIETRAYVIVARDRTYYKRKVKLLELKLDFINKLESLKNTHGGMH